MKFEVGDTVQLSMVGRLRGANLGLLPRSPVGRITGIEQEEHPGGPWEAVYVVDFDGHGMFLSEGLIEEVRPLDLLAKEAE